MFRVAAQNMARRPLRAALLGLSVTLAVGVGFAGFVGGWALRDGVVTSFSRMGADIVVVPAGALVNLTSTLLTVQPTETELDLGLAAQIRNIPGVGNVAPQRVVRAQAEGRAINLIAFDPQTDFTVQPWRPPQSGAKLDGDAVLIGERVGETSVDRVLSICGQSLPVTARLGHTGVGPFDESYFITFATLEKLIQAWRAICHAAGIAVGSDPFAANTPPVAAAEEVTAHRHKLLTGPASCLPELKSDKVSALLVQLAPGASAQQVMFAIGQIPNVKQVAGNSVFTTTRQALGTLFNGAVVVAALLLLGLLILISMLFSAIVQERYRELGLLRAMGARPNHIMNMILAEAAAITLMGGVFGLGFGVALVFGFARTLGFYFASLKVPFAWPPTQVTAAVAATALVVSAALGAIGAFLPSWRARRVEPYVMIVGEGAP
jgi:putative ABC transport system permease protein